MSKRRRQPPDLRTAADLPNVKTRVHVGRPMLPVHTLMQTLEQCGVQLPEETVTVEIKIPVDGLMQIVYTCNVTGGLAHKIGKALQVQAVKDRLT